MKKWISGLKSRTRGKKGFNIIRFRYYLEIMKHYLTYTKLNPKQLIDELEKDEKKDRRKREFPAREKIIGFFEYLKNLGLAPKSCEGYTASIRGFYKHNGFPISVHIPKQENIKSKIALDRNLIKKVLDNVQKVRDKVIILIMVSSGMSIYDVLDLEYRHVNKNEIPILIDFRRTKNNQHYKTFISSECSNLLKDYIEIYRKPEHENDLLFLKDGKHLNYHAFRYIISNISLKIIGNTNINTKSFRRFFSSQMKKAGVSSDIVNFWMGHSIGVERNYLDEMLRDVYKSKEYTVTINLTLNKDEIILNKQTIEEINRKLLDQSRKINELEDMIYQLFDDKIK